MRNHNGERFIEENAELSRHARVNLRIRRTMRPREILIRTKYPVTLVFPFYTRSDTLNLEVQRPL